MTYHMQIQLERNDNVYDIEYDTKHETIGEVLLNGSMSIDIDNLFVAVGKFPNIRYIPLKVEILKKAYEIYLTDHAPYKDENEEHRLTGQQLGVIE